MKAISPTSGPESPRLGGPHLHIFRAVFPEDRAHRPPDEHLPGEHGGVGQLEPIVDTARRSPTAYGLAAGREDQGISAARAIVAQRGRLLLPRQGG